MAWPKKKITVLLFIIQSIIKIIYSKFTTHKIASLAFSFLPNFLLHEEKGKKKLGLEHLEIQK